MADLDQILADTLAGGSAIDGDTIRTDSSTPDQRVVGFDAPETSKPEYGKVGQPNAGVVTRVLQEVLDGGGTVTPTGETDVHGRGLSKVTRADGEDFADFAIRNGLGAATTWSTQRQRDMEAAGFVQRQGILPELMTAEEQRIAAQRSDQPWEFDFGSLGGEGRSTRSAFGKGIARGADNLQATGFAAANAVGELLGVEGVGEEGLRRNLMEAANNPAEIGEWDNVNDLADFGTYLAEALGEQVPNLLGMATGAGTVATAAKAAFGKSVLQGLAKKYGPEAAQKIFTRRAALAGVAGTSYPMGVGEIQMELKEGGVSAPEAALVGAFPFAVLDAAGLGFSVSRFFGPAVKDKVARTAVESLWPELAKRAGLGAATGFTAEGATEAAQEGIVIAARAYADPEYDPFTEENLKRLREAAIKGGLVGGILGAAGGGVEGYRNYSNRGKEDDTTNTGELDNQEAPPAEPPAAAATAPQPDASVGVGAPLPPREQAAAREAQDAELKRQAARDASAEADRAELLAEYQSSGETAETLDAQPQTQQPEPPVTPEREEQQRDVDAELRDYVLAEIASGAKNSEIAKGLDKEARAQLRAATGAKNVIQALNLLRKEPPAQGVADGTDIRVGTTVAPEDPVAGVLKQVVDQAKTDKQLEDRKLAPLNETENPAPADAPDLQVTRPDAPKDLNSDTMPEPVQTIAAGLQAVADGRKLSAYSKDPGIMRQALSAVQAPWRLFPTEDGGVIAVLAKNAEKVASLEAEGKRNEALGYVQSKEEALAAGGELFAVRAIDSKGREVSAQAVSRDKVEDALAAAREQAGPGGTTDVTTVPDSLALRAELRKAEESADVVDESRVEVDSQYMEEQQVRRISLFNLPAAAVRHVSRFLPKGHKARIVKAPAKTGKDGKVIENTNFVSFEADLPPTNMSDSEKQRDGGRLAALGENPSEVLRTLGQIFVSGEASETGRIMLEHKGMGKDGAQIKANVGEIAKLGALVGERPFDGNESEVFRAKVNFLNGMAFLRDAGYELTEAIPNDTKVLGYTYSQLKKATSVSRVPAGVEVPGVETGNAQQALRIHRTLDAQRKALRANPKDAEAKQKLRSAEVDLVGMYPGAKAEERLNADVTRLRGLLAGYRRMLSAERRAGTPTFKFNWDDLPQQAKKVLAEGYADQTPEQQLETIRTAGEALGQTSRFIEGRKDASGKVQPRKVQPRKPQRATAVKATREEAYDEKYGRDGTTERDDEIFALDNAGIGEDTNTDVASDTTEMGEQNERTENERKRFETEEDRTARKKTEPTDRHAGQVTHDKGAHLKSAAGFVRDMLEYLGLPTRVRIVEGEAGGNGKITFTKEGAVITLDPALRSDNKLRARVLMHELGHLIQRASLDQADAATIKAVRAAFDDKLLRGVASKYTNDEAGFSEWFADELHKWIAAREKPRTILGRFFKAVANKMRSLFRKGKLGGVLAPDVTFAAWMDGMAGVAAARRGEKTVLTGQAKVFAAAIADLQMPVIAKTGKDALGYQLPGEQNYWGQSAVDKAMGTKPGALAKRVGKGSWNMLQGMHGFFTQSAGSYLRSRGQGWLADIFHVAPNARGKNRLPDIEQRVRKIGGPLHVKLLKALEPFSINNLKTKAMGHREGRLNLKDPDYIAAQKALIDAQITGRKPTGLSPKASKLYDDVREILDDMHAELTRMGLKIDKREQFFPIVVDQAQWMADEERILRKLQSLGKSPREADKIYRAVLERGVFELPLTTEERPNSATPGFASANARYWTQGEVKALRDYLITDISTVLNGYIESGLRRGAINSAPITSMDGRSTKPSGKIYRVKDEKGNEKEFNDPMYGIYKRLDEELLAGNLSHVDHKRIKEKVLPALMGQLGAGMDPRLKNLSQAAIAFQNIRLLGFVVLSSLVDPAGLIARGGVKATWQAAKETLHKSTRKDLYSQASMIGTMRHDLTEHIVNDAFSADMLAKGPAVWSEHFFRLVRAQAWTNFTRVMALSAGKHFLREQAALARQGDKRAKRYLDELNISHEEIHAWVADQSPVGANSGHDRVDYALLQFVDEAILRPNASHRPAWASHPGMAVFWHLKSFMWSYYEVILKHIWSEGQARWNETEGAAKLQAAIPAALLVATALPLGLLGYEARQLLGHLGGDEPEWKDKKGMDLAWEITQRTGLLGPMQMFVDMGDAAERRRFALLATLGPTVGHLEEWMFKPLDTTFLRSIPGVAQSPAAREWAKENIFGN